MPKELPHRGSSFSFAYVSIREEFESCRSMAFAKWLDLSRYPIWFSKRKPAIAAGLGRIINPPRRNEALRNVNLHAIGIRPCVQGQGVENLGCNGPEL